MRSRTPSCFVLVALATACTSPTEPVPREARTSVVDAEPSLASLPTDPFLLELRTRLRSNPEDAEIHRVAVMLLEQDDVGGLERESIQSSHPIPRSIP